MNLLSIRVRIREKTSIFDLKGDIIGSWALRLKEKLMEVREEGIRSIILNFRDVASMDSLGFMVVIEAMTAGMRIHGVHLPVSRREVFEQHGVELKTYTDENSALEALRDTPLSIPERRRAPRTKTQLPVEFITSRGTFRGVILDVSEGGALLGYCDPLQEEALRESNMTLNVEIRPFGYIRLVGKAVGLRDHLEMPAVGLSLLRNSPPSPEPGKEL